MRWIQAIACKICIHKCCSIWCINTTVRTRPADYSWHLCNVCSHMHKGASLPYSLQTGWWWSYLIFVGAVDCGTLGQLLFWHILLYLFKAVFVFARHLEFNLGLLWIAKVHKLLLLLGPGQPSCRQIYRVTKVVSILTSHNTCRWNCRPRIEPYQVSLAADDPTTRCISVYLG